MSMNSLDVITAIDMYIKCRSIFPSSNVIRVYMLCVPSMSLYELCVSPDYPESDK